MNSKKGIVLKVLANWKEKKGFTHLINQKMMSFIKREEPWMLSCQIVITT